MDFVDYINALFQRCGRIDDLFAYVAYIVNAVIARGVKLNHVCCGAVVNRYAGGTFSARLAVLRVFAIDRLGENFRGCRFAGSACSAEKICMRDLAGFALALEHCSDMLLTEHILKSRGTVFSVQ